MKMNNLIKPLLLMAIVSQASAQNAFETDRAKQNAVQPKDFRYQVDNTTLVESLSLKSSQKADKGDPGISKKYFHVETFGTKSSAGGHDGNGGDACENKIENIG